MFSCFIVSMCECRSSVCRNSVLKLVIWSLVVVVGPTSEVARAGRAGFSSLLAFPQSSNKFRVWVLSTMEVVDTLGASPTLVGCWDLGPSHSSHLEKLTG